MKKKFFIACSASKNIEYWVLKKKYIVKKKQIIQTKGTPQPLKYNKENNLLYVGERLPNKIVTYQINNNNNKIYKVHEINIFNTPNYISLSKNKKILFCASYHGNGIISFILNKNGIIQKINDTIKNLHGCHFIKMHYKYNLILASALQDNKIYVYTLLFRENNIVNLVLKNIAYTKKNSGPRHITFHPKNDYFYSINEFHGTVDVWFISVPVYQLILMQSISLIFKPYIHSPWASDIHIHPTGIYLYACDRSNNIISLFTVNNQTGFLSYIRTYKTESQPRSFDISSDGKILIVLGELSNSMTIYKININNGYLLFKCQKSLGNNPLWITLE